MRLTSGVVVMTVLLWLPLSQASAEGNDKPSIEAELKSVLSTQAASWNRADIDSFMEHYWKSDKLTFSSSGKTTRGWSATKANYKRRYPTAKKMGKLTFDELEFTSLGTDAALVLGRWHLKREDDSLGGNFSLIFRRINRRWVIVHDHTSRLAKEGR